MPGVSHAYNEAGHYFTLVALLDSATGPDAPKLSPEELKLEAFCTELPDMAQELDATSQRIAVLHNKDDLKWGLLGQCQTPLSKHMVSAQYYLHGLTGTDSAPVREAAKNIMDLLHNEIDQYPDTAPNKDKRVSLICARGFAIHLYGDSYAHVTLASDGPSSIASFITKLFSKPGMQMYPTGIGHLFDVHKPDYLEDTHSLNTWDKFVRDEHPKILSQPIPAEKIKSILNIKQHCGITDDCENKNQRVLQSLIEKNNQAAPILFKEMESLIIGEPKLFFGELAWTCEQAVDKLYKSSDPNRPKCEAAWQDYLKQAIKVFNDKQIKLDPTNHPGATANHNCSAWRCKDKSVYSGETPGGKCEIEITDKLRDGIPR